MGASPRQPFQDPGVIAVDTLDGDLVDKVILSGIVDSSTPGVYEISFNVSDYAGNKAVKKIRKVTVRDTSGPVIELLGDGVVSQEAGFVYVEPGYTANEIVDGDITSLVEVEGDVDIKKIGSYVLTFQVNDIAGNVSNVKSRTVVVADTQPPTISIEGENSIKIEGGGTYEDTGAIALDVFDGDISVTHGDGGAVVHQLHDVMDFVVLDS